MSRLRALGLSLLVTLVSTAGCDFGVRLSGKPEVESAKTTKPAKTAEPKVAAKSDDPIGPKPELAPPKAFDPPSPEVFQGPGGLTVWLIERPDLPVVLATFVTPYGSASDPEDAPGSMALLADMLDEGAGSRNALQLSETVASLGATLSVSAGQDASSASVLSLRSKFDTTFEILCDVVARPKLGDGDFQRTKKLWKNNLKKRADDPMSVASVVAGALLYGPTAPYGHPSLGLFSKADSVTLPRVKGLYEKTWRPERATLVVAGQISRKDLEAALTKNLGAWKPKGEPLVAPKLTAPLGNRPKLVLVDRPNAVQTVIYAVREGTSASDQRAPSLGLINDALGGSFTSRLNMNLREEKGWTYGVGSGFTSARGEGVFLIRTSVEAVHTGASLKEVTQELSKLADKGLTDEEVSKVKAQDRASLVETYEGVTGTGSRFSQLVTAGLPASFDAGASRIRQAATKDDLARLAKAHFDPKTFTIVLVGDKATVTKQLEEQGLGTPVAYTAEGQPIP